MSVYRAVVGRRGVSIPARSSAKVKTLVQDLAIGLCLAPPLAGHGTVLSAAIWVATALTVFSGAQYYLDGRRAVSTCRDDAKGCPSRHGSGHRATVGRPRYGGLSRSRPCGSRSSPSAPSCCSGRSRTPTRGGWGRSWPPPALPPTSTRPSATTARGSCSRSRTALARSDGVIVCGGLGPTHDDITREAIAEVMNVPLLRDESLIEAMRAVFAARGRQMPESNLRQADVPEGASVIRQTMGTAPGLICPIGHKVLYAVPGVPYEMEDMFVRAVAPDLRRRMAERGELAGVIASRVIRTWGMSESGLAEALADHIAELDEAATSPERADGDHCLPGQRHRRHQGAGHGAGRGRRGGGGHARRGGADGAGHPPAGGRRRRVRHRRRGHRGRRGQGPRRSWPHSGIGGVVDRRPGRLAPRERGRSHPVVPGLGGLVRVGGEVRRARVAGRAGRLGRCGAGHGRRGAAGAGRRRRSLDDGRCRSRPAGGQSTGHRLRGARPSRTTRRCPSRSTCPATATVSGSTRPSPRSTCCDGLWPTRSADSDPSWCRSPGRWSAWSAVLAGRALSRCACPTVPRPGMPALVPAPVPG